MLRADSSLMVKFLDSRRKFEKQSLLLDAETRWHYSQHSLAEARGEEVLENMLVLTTGKKQRAILTAQLRDELNHQSLFEEQTGRIGLDTRAGRYASAYCALVLQQDSLAEKAFVFQILTEAISAAYCQWRLRSVGDRDLVLVDRQVEEDERRHLVMGQTMIGICDRDEVRECLAPLRQRQLLREMNEICLNAIRVDMIHTLAEDFQIDNVDQNLATDLDRLIVKSVVGEYRTFQLSQRKLELEGRG